MRQLTSLDAQFLAIESSRAFGHVAGLAIYDPSTAPGGELTEPDICRLVGERIHLLPPFTQKLVTIPFDLGHPYWIEDPDFDLDFHVREIGLAPPGDERQLAEQVARIVARPLDRARPLWELYLIRGLEGGRDALLTKVHHAAVDGVSGNEILAIMLDLHPEGREIEPPRPRRGERRPSQLSLLGRGLLAVPCHSANVAGAIPSAVRNIDALPGVSSIPGVRLMRRAGHRAAGVLPGPLGKEGLLETPAARAPRTRFNGPITPHRRFAFGSLPRRYRQGGQERAGRDRQRRRGRVVRVDARGVASGCMCMAGSGYCGRGPAGRREDVQPR
jgi:diacylglycerol O-acyltransferase